MEKTLSEKPFKLLFAPNPSGWCRHLCGGCSGLSDADKVEYFYDRGFRAMEYNEYADLPVEAQEAIATRMRRLGMRMGVFAPRVGSWEVPNLTGNILDPKSRSRDREGVERMVRSVMEKALAAARRSDAEWFTVVIGAEDPSLEYEYQFANVVEHLKRASEFLEKNGGPTMVLESLNIKNHPGLWLKRIPQAYAVCKAVGSPKCKILNDLYHQQVTEGSLIPNIDAAWDEIAYFQIADNPGRNEPGTGEINYSNVMRHIAAKGYRGVIGLELVQSKPGAGGDKFFLDSVRAIDAA